LARSCFTTASVRVLGWRFDGLRQVFGDLLKRNPTLLDWVGRFSGALLILGVVAFFIGRLIRRRMVLKNLVARASSPKN